MRTNCLSALELVGKASVTAYTTLTFDNNGNRTNVNTAGGNIAYTWDDQIHYAACKMVNLVHGGINKRVVFNPQEDYA